MNVISVADKTTRTIPGGGTGGTWQTQVFLGESEFDLDWNGRGTVHLQARFKNPADETLWPEWLEVRTVRVDGDDDTGDHTYPVPHKRNWALLYLVEMDLTGPVKLQIRHNGSAAIERLKGIIKVAPKVTEVVVR